VKNIVVKGLDKSSPYNYEPTITTQSLSEIELKENQTVIPY
jgi:hypothetical protein